MRYAVGTVSLECNSFSPERTTLDYFRRNGYLLHGDEIVTAHHSMRNELAGFLEVCRRRGIQAVPTVAAWAIPHGLVRPEAYAELKAELLARLGAAEPLDGVYLSLHGSMVVEGLDDPEGEPLESVRNVIGDRPLVATLDFHGNVTSRIARAADILVGYNSFPHTNLFETGQKAAELAWRHHGRTRELRRVFVKIPLVAPMERMTIVGEEPMVRLVREMAAAEDGDGILALSVFGVQCWLDIEEMGCSVIGVARGRAVERAREVVARTARGFWELREIFMDFPFHSPDDAIRLGLASDAQPIVLNEPADNVGAGATGDSTYLLEALLRQRAEVPTYLPIVDPEAVAAAAVAGVGAEIALPVGGKLNRRFSKPVVVRGRVRTLFDGRYRYAGPMFHGVETSMGRTAVLEVGRTLFIELTELPVWTIDPEHYRCVGLMPERAKFLAVKSQGSFKAAYEGLAKQVLYLDTPGISGSNLRNLPYERIDRGNLYPWNETQLFEPEPVFL